MALADIDKMATSEPFRVRVRAAVRSTAYAKRAAEGAPGELARSAVRDPGLYVEDFLAIMLADTTITDFACPNCGYADVPDGNIVYVVNAQWDTVAGKRFGTAV